ncbi:MAG: FecR domain-containing protein, partial [Kofleriaceae bacterium]
MQGKLGPPPVDPLSDVAWARVERGLWTRLDADERPMLRERPPARRWLWLGAPALALAAAVALVVAMRGGPEPTLDGQPVRLASGAAPSAMSFGDAHVTLDADSIVVMSRDTRAASALLERGAAWFAIAPRAGRPPFVVMAGDAIVRVIGTRFRVARSDDRAAVEVDHGTVEIQFRGATVRVGAGQRWSSVAPTVVSRVTTQQVTAQQATTEPAAPAAAEPAAAAAEPPGAEPADPEPPRAEPTAPTTPPDRDRRPKPPATPSDAAADRATFERLAALEVRDPAAAIDGYLALSRRSGPWAELSLFAAGRLAA